MSPLITVVTDSTAYLPQEEITRLGIVVVPLQVVVGGRALILAGHPIAYVSGRIERTRRRTERWLRTHVGHFDSAEGLWLRPNGDRRPDTVWKAEIYREHLAGKEIAGVIEDRVGVVRMWRSLGLTVLQVADGNY